MHLRNRCRGDRLRVEFAEHRFDAAPQATFDLGNGQCGVEGRHIVLQLREFFGDIGGQQIAPRGQHLSELDEDRPERFQRHAQACAARCVQLATQAQGPGGCQRPA